ncbi:unnamed protein product [Ilex paraguariensis]|uniref:Protein kinase domain-containing protein n=1 Tax=Ilex paraguariensis TaxID=185542 RepID=A0ABC8S8A8_9AQUA
MAQSVNKERLVVGDYVVGKQIGAGSFSTVWHARHGVDGTEVAIKEMDMTEMNKRLQESLMSEIHILRQINHPNIIRLHDMIEEAGKIYIVLEYCQGGDLSLYIRQHQGRILEITAKHFMQQLGAGLQFLRANNIIHRDLKPQNLLLSTKDDRPVLKIADFGFARSLQPRGLAETICGSPFYMAPEMLQLQKYDAKADLWSVGAILFQLVTGKTPFTGVNEIQLLQNIVKSTELHFPPDKRDLSAGCIDLCQKLLRCNPVERLTFAEFFNHPFLSQTQPDASSRNWRSSRIMVPLPGGKPLRNTDESSQEDCLPFRLDDDSSSPDGSPSFIRRSPLGSTCANTKNKTDHTSKFSSVTHNPLNTGFRIDSCRPSEGNMKESSKSMDHRPVNTPSNVIESMEFIERDYVFVSGPPMDVSISASGSKPSHLLSKSGSPPLASGNINSTSSSPMQIIGAATSNIGCVGSFERQSFVPFGTSPGSVNAWDVLEQRSTDCLRRIRSLQQCASAITELVKEKVTHSTAPMH